MNVGNNLRRLRNNGKKSQQEMADLLEIDRKTYINWENGTNDVKSDYIPKLAEILEVEIGELFRSPISKIDIIQNHNEAKENSLLNGAIIIITDKEAINDIVSIVKQNLEKKP